MHDSLTFGENTQVHKLWLCVTEVQAQTLQLLKLRLKGNDEDAIATYDAMWWCTDGVKRNDEQNDSLRCSSDLGLSFHNQTYKTDKHVSGGNQRATWAYGAPVWFIWPPSYERAAQTVEHTQHTQYIFYTFWVVLREFRLIWFGPLLVAERSFFQTTRFPWT